MDKDKVCLFSGRFDAPHCGHIKTVTDLGQRFKKVLVVVLDHPEQKYPVQYRAQIMRDILANCKGEYEVIVNQYHFGKISIDSLLKYDFHVYAAGNLEVLKHIEKIVSESMTAEERGITTLWVDRPYEIDASTERLGRIIKEML